MYDDAIAGAVTEYDRALGRAGSIILARGLDSLVERMYIHVL
jgi:hypothetical protein